MSRMLRVVWLVVLLSASVSVPAPAQAARRALLGGAVGVAGGGVVTLSAIVARARFQREYLDSADDLIHWQTIPMIAAPGAGILFGLAGHDAHVGSMIGSTTGMATGAALGAGLGWLLSDQQEWPWAGAVIGAGVGLTIGGMVGGLRAWKRDEDPEIKFPDTPFFIISIPTR